MRRAEGAVFCSVGVKKLWYFRPKRGPAACLQLHTIRNKLALLPAVPVVVRARVLPGGAPAAMRGGARIFRQYVTFREAAFVTFWAPIRENQLWRFRQT